MNIRKAKYTDINDIVNLHTSIVDWMSKTNLKQWYYNDIYRLLTIFQINEFFLLEHDKDIIGFVIISQKDINSCWTNFATNKTLYLYKLAIKREYAKLGYSQELLNFSKKYGASMGYERICLLCLKRKNKLVKLYINSNFYCIHESIIQLENEPSLFMICNLDKKEKMYANEKKKNL